MRTLDKVGELVELLARVACAAFGADTADVCGLVEYAEFASAFEHIHQFDEFHAETHVRFVRTETTHGLFPRHADERCGKVIVPYFLEKIYGHFFEQRNDVVLLDKAHFAVNLGEFWLTV